MYKRQIIGGNPKNWGVPGYAHGPFSRNFFMGFCSDGPLNVSPNMKSVTLPVYEIIAIEVWGVGETQPWGRGGRRRSGMVPFEGGFITSYRHSIVTFPLSLPVSEILPFFVRQCTNFFFWGGGYPLLSQERVKPRTSNSADTFTGSIRANAR